MKIKPLNDSILLRPDKDEVVGFSPEVTKAINEKKLIIPDIVRGFISKNAMRGTVIAWGKDCQYEYKEGERIIFARFAGAKVKDKEETLLMIKEYEALAKEEND